ncbi:putative Transposable element Tc3 transposase [Blattamonas nauphoetae]|uniref:Transposable element Tc3 transposase n=1 Tax=Blattamonas nauphoetae TaxID=2049346 RepID=A0ABQ9YKL6_9EUKA|nr:putative Transposable element Tc3 transposase [Blattamonas nauphoetae]
MKTDHFLFDDEKSFRSVGARKYNQSLHLAKTPAKETPSPVRPFTVGVWAAIGVGFKSDIEFTPKSVNGTTYSQIVAKHLGNERMTSKNENRILLSDNAPWHKSKVAIQALRSAKIDIQYNPPLSPDMNPIENIWAWMSDRIYQGGKQYKTKEELKSQIEHTWNELDQDTINKFCRSFGSRVGELIRKDGQLTKY